MFTPASRWVLVVLVGSAFHTLPAGAKEPARASRGEITLPTYPWAAVKHPYFRGTDKVNIYPYPMLDFLSRDKTDRTYRTVILENQYLRLTFLPELGGKVHEVIDKTTSQPMFYVNSVIKPALIGQCGAWTSGGIEWNTGPQGHTVGCMQPVDVVILPRGKDGSQSVAIGETERIYGTKWTVVVTLRPDRAFIEERIRIYNPTETIRPYYFWNCTAVPNTKGFRFIYPMTLGTDHGAEKFFRWPLHEGKDLTRGTNYQDASSIFAWHCDQDFFGSYNDDLDRGVVACGNHHQLPGKKAWTWGWGSYGTMHQMDLTDDDGPYNEVQTGPLLTQGEVGRLDPCEAVEWSEWWYPVHALGGFTFANQNLAANANVQGSTLNLRVLGSGTWAGAELRVGVGSVRGGHFMARPCDLSPRSPLDLRVPLPAQTEPSAPLWIEFRQGDASLATFRVPLDLPKREPPPKRSAPQTASEQAQTGWQDFLLARFPEAEARFRQTLEADPKSSLAHLGLAFLSIESDPTGAMEEAAKALATAPESGLAHYARAVAADRAQDPVSALDEAWQASLDPATAVAGRALIAKLETRRAGYAAVVGALAETGPWQTDPLCRNRLAFACLKLGDTRRAISLAEENLSVDPLDAFARSVLWLAKARTRSPSLDELLGTPHSFRELIAEYADLAQDDWEPVRRLLEQFYLKANVTPDPLINLWATRVSPRGLTDRPLESKPSKAHEGTSAEEVFPYHVEAVPVLREALAREPNHGAAALFLGHLLFHLGRHAEGRDLWKQAAELGTQTVIAYRALGMAAKTLDGDAKASREWLEKASQADPKDAVVARDLARVLFDLAERSSTDTEKRALATLARDRLQGAFEEGKGRSDFVALLARALTRLGDHAGTARLLDSVRITIWEGAREAHDLFEEAHLTLGKQHLEGGRPAEALVEFDRALEYPANLATGKLENTREAHIHYLRGNALAALGREAEATAAWKLAADEPSAGDSNKEEARKKAKEALDQATR
jgi:tetratricopeptide (TPR) repeat protein